MAHIAPHADHEPLPETDWLSEFPSEDEMDSAWSQSRTDENPFDFFAHEETASADVPLLRPADEPQVVVIDPAIRLIAPEPAVTEVAVAGDRGTRAPRVRRPLIAAVAAGSSAVLAAAMFFVVPRTITTPELPPRLVSPIAAAPSLPPLALAPPPEVPIAAPPEPPTTTAPPADLDRLNNRTAAAKPAPAAPPTARPAPASPTTTTGARQQLPPPPPPALALTPVLQSAPPGIGRGNSVLVSPPPELPTPSRPPAEPGRGSAAPVPAASTTPPAPDLAAATAAVEIAAIDAVLGGYRRAFNALDVARVEQVWPEVDRRALERAFRGLAKQTFEFDTCQVRPNGTEAQASCSGRASYVPKVGGRAPQVETREWQFRLTKRNGRWVIAAVESKR